MLRSGAFTKSNDEPAACSALLVAGAGSLLVAAEPAACWSREPAACWSREPAACWSWEPAACWSWERPAGFEATAALSCDTQHPWVLSRRYLEVSGDIRRYPEVSGDIRRYPEVSGVIRSYPRPLVFLPPAFSCDTHRTRKPQVPVKCCSNTGQTHTAPAEPRGRRAGQTRFEQGSNRRSYLDN